MTGAADNVTVGSPNGDDIKLPVSDVNGLRPGVAFAKTYTRGGLGLLYLR